MMKIDAFTHFFPPASYRKMMQVAPTLPDIGKRMRHLPLLVDLEARFRVMDEFGDYRQILALPNPPLERLADSNHSPELARIANDGMAELVRRHPDRFFGFTASLPMNNPDAIPAEIERAIKQLGALGVQLHTNVVGRPLDDPRFSIIWELMAGHDLPIWLHPTRTADFPDYLSEKRSRYEIWWTLGWPYDTSVAMARLVFSGVFDRFPDLKIITHHLGGMIPYFEGRLGPGCDELGARTSEENLGGLLKVLKKRPLDYFRQFYGDTALFGAAPATRCGLEFFGVEHVLFGSDDPFSPEPGMYIREGIRIIEELDLSKEEKDRIFRGNLERLIKAS